MKSQVSFTSLISSTSMLSVLREQDLSVHLSVNGTLTLRRLSAMESWSPIIGLQQSPTTKNLHVLLLPVDRLDTLIQQ